MSGDYMAVRISEIEATISAFNTHQTHLEEVMHAIKGQINNMASWQGDTHDRFEEAMERWNHQMANSHEVLGEVGANLKDFLDHVRELNGL
jgi:WXG100 family type VII secretion target